MSDYKERLKQERDELFDRTLKLDHFLSSKHSVSERQQDLLEIQLMVMKTYLGILNKRLEEIENI